MTSSTNAAPRPCVQQRARRHGEDGIHGKGGIVESATCRIYSVLSGSNPTLSAIFARAARSMAARAAFRLRATRVPLVALGTNPTLSAISIPQISSHSVPIRPSIDDRDEQSALLVEPPHLGVFGVLAGVPRRSQVAPGFDLKPIAFPPHGHATPCTIDVLDRPAVSDDATDRSAVRTDVIGLGTHSALEVPLNRELQEGRRHRFAQNGGPLEGLTDRQGSRDVHAWLRRIGVTRQTVNAIELGKYSPSLEVAFRIAAVFRVPLDQVFQYDGDRTASEKKKV